MWEVISNELAVGFSDLGDLASFTRFALRVVVAVILGALLGWEREHHGKAAGMRTHMLVTLGSAVFVLMPVQLGWSAADLSRVVQGLITGIGFLGAGTILKRSEPGQIRGLTTAADVWLSAGIGIAVGLGQLAAACLAAALGFTILFLAFHVGPRDRRDQA